MRKQKMYASINIAGLAVGLACCLFILMYIQRELSYDQLYDDVDQLYRLVIEYNESGTNRKSAFTSTPLAETLQRDYPEVVLAGRIAPDMFGAGSNLVRTENQVQNRFEEGFVYADQAILTLFGFKMQEGEQNTALDAPFSVVLSQKKANQLFPDGNAIGKGLILNNNLEQPFTVTGVIEDLPVNTHFEFEYLISMETLEVSRIPNWGFVNYITYARLAPGAASGSLEAQLPGMIEQYQTADIEAARQSGRSFRYTLQSIADIHLHSSDVSGYWTHGDIQYLWLFGSVALFILLIAAINFMNLSTARSANRAKEIGLRKVFGSIRKQLITQFLAESILVSLLAVTIGSLAVWLLLPYFNDLTGQTFEIPWSDWRIYPLLLGFTLLIGLLAGTYPSAFLSNFRPIQVLKGKLSTGSQNGTVRSALVIFQFTASIVLIISSLVVWRQMDYIQNKKLGFEKEQVLIVEDSYTLQNQIQAFKSELKQLPEVSEVSVTNFVPVGGYGVNWSGAWPANSSAEESEVTLAKWFVDHDYVATMGMSILEGRDFSLEIASDSQAVLINKKAAQLLGFENPIGEQFTSYTRLDVETGELLSDTYTIIGLIDDFHFESMKKEISGISLVIGNSTGSTLIKTNTVNLNATLQKIEQIWSGFAPNQAFRYSFLDDQFSSMYTFEERAGKILGVFTILAILVACLGLLALAAFMAEQRLREISVRKVLGASVADIVFLLTRNFATLVIIALLAAVPVGWLLMDNWLQDFAFRISLSWDIFVLAGWMALIVAVLTISYQAIKVAIVNPATILRGE